MPGPSSLTRRHVFNLDLDSLLRKSVLTHLREQTLYYGVHKRYNHEDLEDVHDVLVLSHHFIICENLMPNFQVGFVRAVMQLWKNIVFKGVHSLEILVTSRPSFFQKCHIMFSQPVDLAIAKANEVIFWP